jgi:predicted transcriptional regulator
MNTIQDIITQKAKLKAEKKAEDAVSNFIEAMRSSYASERIVIKPDFIDDNGNACFHSISAIVIRIKEHQLAKLVENQVGKDSKEFYDKIESMQRELDSYMVDFEGGE